MLTRLSIRNIVLIEALDLEFRSGLGVLTGETGAGKSILLDALGLVLGNRADSGLVRGGEEQASVTASGTITSSGNARATAISTPTSCRCDRGSAMVRMTVPRTADSRRMRSMMSHQLDWIASIMRCA